MKITLRNGGKTSVWIQVNGEAVARVWGNAVDGRKLDPATLEGLKLILRPAVYKMVVKSLTEKGV